MKIHPVFIRGGDRYVPVANLLCLRIFPALTSPHEAQNF